MRQRGRDRSRPTLKSSSRMSRSAPSTSRPRHPTERVAQYVWGSREKTIVFVTHSVEEAVLLLADRIVVMHSHPGRIAALIPVDVPRPRKRTSVEFDALESRVLDLLDGGGA